MIGNPHPEMSAPLAQMRFHSSQLLHIYAQPFMNLLIMWLIHYHLLPLGGKKKNMGKKMCSSGGAVSYFLNIQSNPPGLSLSSFLPKKLHGSPKTSHKKRGG